MSARSLAVLYDRVGEQGGAERYWETVIPALRAHGTDVHLFGRRVDQASRFGATATEIRWSHECEPPNAHAAAEVATALRASGAHTVVTANVFDADVLAAVRAYAGHWVVRLHDHRAFCPNGDRLFPQFPAICEGAMGVRCAVNALVHGCVQGPRPASMRRIALRNGVRELITQADRVVVCSGAMAESARRNGIAAQRIAVIAPPLPDAAFGVPCARPPRDAIIFSGRLSANKGLRSLIAALALIPVAERPLLIVAGRGDPEERLAREDAQRRGVGAEWRGWLDAPALRATIDEASLLAMPSLWPEPFGLAGIEAQARGRPAVAYDVGGIPDWIDGAGLAVARGDVAALAAAIRHVLREDVWPGLARAARSRAERWRLDEHLGRISALFHLELTPAHEGRTTA